MKALAPGEIVRTGLAACVLVLAGSAACGADRYVDALFRVRDNARFAGNVFSVLSGGNRAEIQAGLA